MTTQNSLATAAEFSALEYNGGGVVVVVCLFVFVVCLFVFPLCFILLVCKAIEYCIL